MREGRVGGGGGLSNTLEQKSSHYVLMEVQKGGTFSVSVRCRRLLEAVSHQV